ncbi:MAG: HNH endonuclease, partial [Gemmatimonadales bacterium]
GFADVRPGSSTDSGESQDGAREPEARVAKLGAGPVGSSGDAGDAGAKADSDSAESVSGSGCGCVPPSPSAERYMVMVNVPYQTLTGKGVADVDGRAIPSETARRLACDASVVRIVRGPSSEVLDVGRRTRTIPPAIRRALWSRDGGCAFPGCGRRYVSAHHILHWADGGATSLDNLVLLCPSHHRGVHETGFTVKLGRDRLPRFFNRAGVRIPDQAPPPALGPDPVEETLRTHRLRGVDPDDWTGVCRRQVSDENWLRFQEALDPSDP